MVTWCSQPSGSCSSRRCANGREAADGVVAQLSGGLDSSAIAASADILTDRNDLPRPFATASVRFPGSSADETRWIDEIAASQPFPHQAIDAVTPSLDDLAADMRIADSPYVPRIREMWTFPAAVAGRIGANTVMTGVGGDEVLEQDQMLIDRVGQRPVSLGVRDLWSLGRHQPHELGWVTTRIAKDAVPASWKARYRRFSGTPPSIAHPDLIAYDATSASATWISDAAYPTWTQYGIIAATQSPGVAWHFEGFNALLARQGASLTAPFLDRTLVEFLAGVHPIDRPFDGRTKTLVRTGFHDRLPASVLGRAHGTTADEYLATSLRAQAPAFTDAFPSVPEGLEHHGRPLGLRRPAGSRDRGPIHPRGRMVVVGCVVPDAVGCAGTPDDVRIRRFR